MTLATSIYLQITGYYDKQGASATCRACFSASRSLYSSFRVHVLERKEYNTLASKAA